MSEIWDVSPAPETSSRHNSILHVSPHAEHVAGFRDILNHRQWSVTHCSDTSSAVLAIEKKSLSVVVTESHLPDGSWRSILEACQRQHQAPLVLVTCRHADESLWAEVLNLGGFDVLLEPFDRTEVPRVVGMALRSWSALFGDRLNSQENTKSQFA
ncbi:MAG: response regulator [Bryobacteraceae bacterium]|nr:response regulator [Bryobacteraceae bacterium]